MDSDSERRAQYRADAGGSVSRQVVVGDRNVVVNPEGGSAVTVRTGEQPRVTRRVPPDAEPPRPGPEPLGRERELAAIVQALDDGLPVQVHGNDGSGRSTVLRYVAQTRGGDRDVVFLSAGGLAIDDLLQTLFDACFDNDGYRPEPLRMRTLMETVRALLVVDDFDGDAEDFKALLDAAPACEIVVASREQTLFSGGFAVELGGLGEAAGVALLARGLGRNVAGAERADATALWRATGGNPLALVQAAAAVREGAGTLADFRDSRQMVQALARSLTEPQRQVLGILSLIGPVPAPAALLRVLAGPPGAAAVERLVATGLVAEGQPRITGPVAEHVAALAGTSVAPARLAEAIIAWLAAGPDRPLLGDSAPLILQVLRATMAAGDYRTAVRLARTASPRLAMALHLGAWGTLLELGHSAARVVNAADDELYFAHEAAARLNSLGKAAATETLVETADTAAGTRAAPAVEQPEGPGRGVIRTVVTKPAVWVFVIVAAIAATIAVTAFDAHDPGRLQAAPMVSPTIVPTTSVPPVTSAETTTSGPESTTIGSTPVPLATSVSASAGVSVSAPVFASASAQATSKTLASTDRTMIQPSECVSSVGAVEFTPVMVGDGDKLELTFLSPPCHQYGLATGRMSVQGMDSYAFSFSLVSCPEITTSDRNAPCTIAISFYPWAPGDFTAEIYIPEAGPATERLGHSSILLHGHAD